MNGHISSALARLHNADSRNLALGLTDVQTHALAEHLDAYEAENQRLREESVALSSQVTRKHVENQRLQHIIDVELADVNRRLREALDGLCGAVERENRTWDTPITKFPMSMNVRHYLSKAREALAGDGE